MKRIILLCLVVLIVSFFAGCGNDNSVEPENSTTTADKNEAEYVTITIDYPYTTSDTLNAGLYRNSSGSSSGWYTVLVGANGLAAGSYGGSVYGYRSVDVSYEFPADVDGFEGDYELSVTSNAEVHSLSSYSIGEPLYSANTSESGFYAGMYLFNATTTILGQTMNKWYTKAPSSVILYYEASGTIEKTIEVHPYQTFSIDLGVSVSTSKVTITDDSDDYDVKSYKMNGTTLTGTLLMADL